VTLDVRHTYVALNGVTIGLERIVREQVLALPLREAADQCSQRLMVPGAEHATSQHPTPASKIGLGERILHCIGFGCFRFACGAVCPFRRAFPEDAAENAEHSAAADCRCDDSPRFGRGERGTLRPVSSERFELPLHGRFVDFLRALTSLSISRDNAIAKKVWRSGARSYLRSMSATGIALARIFLHFLRSGLRANKSFVLRAGSFERSLGVAAGRQRPDFPTMVNSHADKTKSSSSRS
jgi:hypothetical protein